MVKISSGTYFFVIVCLHIIHCFQVISFWYNLRISWSAHISRVLFFGPLFLKLRPHHYRCIPKLHFQALHLWDLFPSYIYHPVIDIFLSACYIGGVIESFYMIKLASRAGGDVLIKDGLFEASILILTRICVHLTA